jgi:multimeric flavodoxin WrbA
MTVSVLALNCSLKPGSEPSSTEVLADQLLKECTRQGADAVEQVRVVDFDLKPGTGADMDGGDQWPVLRQKVLASDVLVLALPIWNGQPSSVASRVFERLNAMLSETDDQGRTPLYGKAAGLAVVGNEDGSYHVAGIAYQVLSDMGYTIPPSAMVTWHGATGGEAGDYKDLPEVPQTVQGTLVSLSSNLLGCVRALQATPYPGVPAS